MAEGVPEELAEFLYYQHYKYGGRSSQAEYVRLKTMHSPKFDDFAKTNSLIWNIIVDEYLKKLQNHDMSYGKPPIRRFLTLSTPEHYMDHLKPIMETLVDCKNLAYDGSYLGASILLRSIIEGIIKVGLISKVKAEESHKMYSELEENLEEPDFEEKWGKYLIVDGEKILIDKLGLSQLCKYADKYEITFPIRNLYTEFELYKLNDYSHMNEVVIEKSRIHPLNHLEYKLESWNSFSTMFLSAMKILLLVTHSFAKTLEWFDSSKLDLDLDIICSIIPLYAEALVSEGLIKKCIECRKKLTQKKETEKRRGRCYTCFCKLEG